MDRISELPDNIVETIILTLPLRDAVRTSILSKQWQYKWAALSKLSLDHRFYDAIFKHRRATVAGITYPGLVKTILLQHIGRLETFHIYIPDLAPTRNWEFNLTIRVALKNGIEKLSVQNGLLPSQDPYTLPSFLFSCGDQLTKLELTRCAFNPPHGHRVFSNLQTLHLDELKGSNSEILSDFISSCPKLHTVVLTGFDNPNEHLCIRVPSVQVFTITGNFPSILFQEPLNLVSLDMDMDMNYEDFQNRNRCEDYMLKLFSNLCKIEYLCLGGDMLYVLGGDLVPSKSSTELYNLKTIDVDNLDFGDEREVDSLLFLMRSSPNLQVLEIGVFSIIRDEDFVCDAFVGEYLDWCFQHLRTVRINNLEGSKSELKMIEILLSCSPLLKVMSIGVASGLGKDTKLELSKELMQFCRSSSTARIILS